MGKDKKWFKIDEFNYWRIPLDIENLLLKCNCGNEILSIEIEKIELEDGKIAIPNYIFSIYKDYYHAGFLDKIRAIWNIIRYGHGWCDAVILEKEDIEKLIKFLGKDRYIKMYRFEDSSNLRK